MSSGTYDRLFKQLASVMKLVVDGKRDPEHVSDALQAIIDDIDRVQLELLLTPLDCLDDFPRKGQIILPPAGIHRLGDVVLCSRESLREVKHCGEGTIAKIQAYLNGKGLSLGMRLSLAIRRALAADTA